MLRSLSLVAFASIGCAAGEGLAVDGGELVDAAVVDGPIDAALDAAVDAGCTDEWISLLDNGDFEAGNAVWTETTNGGQMIIREVGAGLPFDPEGGTWGALILGFNNAVVELSQAATVPADATALRLVGFRCWVTEEGAGEFDLMSINLHDDTGAPLETLAAITNEDAAATCAWESFDMPAADPHAGAAITLVLEGTSDAATATSFAFDTLALEALVCR